MCGEFVLKTHYSNTKIWYIRPMFYVLRVYLLVGGTAAWLWFWFMNHFDQCRLSTETSHHAKMEKGFKVAPNRESEVIIAWLHDESQNVLLFPSLNNVTSPILPFWKRAGLGSIKCWAAILESLPWVWVILEHCKLNHLLNNKQKYESLWRPQCWTGISRAKQILIEQTFFTWFNTQQR